MSGRQRRFSPTSTRRTASATIHTRNARRSASPHSSTSVAAALRSLGALTEVGEPHTFSSTFCCLKSSRHRAFTCFPAYPTCTVYENYHVCLSQSLNVSADSSGELRARAGGTSASSTSASANHCEQNISLCSLTRRATNRQPTCSAEQKTPAYNLKMVHIGVFALACSR